MAEKARYTPHVQLLTLIDGQDWQIVRLKASREAIRQEVKAAKARLDRAERGVEELNARIAELDRQRRAGERELADVDARIARTAEMEGVHNQKEYDAAQSALASLRERQSDLEEAGLSTLMELDEVRAQAEEATGAMTRMKAEYKALRARVKVDFDEQGEELGRIAAERQGLLEELRALDPGVFETYEQLMRRYGDRAVTVAVDEGCVFCHLRLIPQHLLEVRLGRALHACQHCGRFAIPPAPTPP